MGYDLSHVRAQRRVKRFLFRYNPTSFLYNNIKHSKFLPYVLQCKI